MEEIRQAASAYYRNLATADKQMAINGFNLMDKTGNGKISLRRYSEHFKQRGLVELTYPEFFKALDSNGDDRLDFNEFITVYYLCMNNKLIFCEECTVFLSGSYMSCLQCFNSGSGKPYNVCCACYRKNNIDHHKDAIFVDNQTLMNSANNNGSAVQSSDIEKITTRDKLTAAILGVSAVNLGINTTKFATTTGPELWENAKHAFDHPLPNPSAAAQSAFNLSNHRRNAVNSTVFNSSNHGTNGAKTASYSSDNAEAASNLSDQISNVLEGASSCSVM